MFIFSHFEVHAFTFKFPSLSLINALFSFFYCIDDVINFF